MEQTSEKRSSKKQAKMIRGNENIGIHIQDARRWLSMQNYKKKGKKTNINVINTKEKENL